MSESFAEAKSSRRVVVLVVIIVAVAVVFAGGVGLIVAYILTRPETTEVRPTPTVQTPAASNAEGISSAPEVQEHVPRGAELAALSGEYDGMIKIPEAEVFGGAALTIKQATFTMRLKSTEQEVSGRVEARSRDGYVDVQLIFDDRSSRLRWFAPGDSNRYEAEYLETNYVLQRLPTLSGRATLTSDGWVITSAPDEKYEMKFTQTNCPPYPYCRPVRRCRPCVPPT